LRCPLFIVGRRLCPGSLAFFPPISISLARRRRRAYVNFFFFLQRGLTFRVTLLHRSPSAPAVLTFPFRPDVLFPLLFKFTRFSLMLRSVRTRDMVCLSFRFLGVLVTFPFRPLSFLADLFPLSHFSLRSLRVRACPVNHPPFFPSPIILVVAPFPVRPGSSEDIG